jgi:hypothetical protein
MTDQRAALMLGFFGVRFETLHQPPFFAPLFGYTRAFHKRGLATRLNNMSAVAQRLLTPDEVDAVAHYHALQLSRSAWAPPATLLTAAYMTHRRRNTFRFPFYTPKPTWFDPWWFALMFPALSSHYGPSCVSASRLLGRHARLQAGHGQRMGSRLGNSIRMDSTSNRRSRTRWNKPSGNLTPC